MEGELKKCSRCKNKKRKSEFYRTRSSLIPSTYCKSCHFDEALFINEQYEYNKKQRRKQLEILSRREYDEIINRADREKVINEYSIKEHYEVILPSGRKSTAQHYRFIHIRFSLLYECSCCKKTLGKKQIHSQCYGWNSINYCDDNLYSKSNDIYLNEAVKKENYYVCRKCYYFMSGIYFSKTEEFVNNKKLLSQLHKEIRKC